jgi:hypothetical protein
MKQTAVEWLVEELEQHYVKVDIKNTVVFQQAKEMEKKQIIDSFEIGYENGACVNEGESIYHGHNYYKKTFKSE